MGLLCDVCEASARPPYAAWVRAVPLGGPPRSLSAPIRVPQGGHRSPDDGGTSQPPRPRRPDPAGDPMPTTHPPADPATGRTEQRRHGHGIPADPPAAPPGIGRHRRRPGGRPGHRSRPHPTALVGEEDGGRRRTRHRPVLDGRRRRGRHPSAGHRWRRRRTVRPAGERPRRTASRSGWGARTGTGTGPARHGPAAGAAGHRCAAGPGAGPAATGVRCPAGPRFGGRPRRPERRGTT